jgi:hypothetical protein
MKHLIASLALAGWAFSSSAALKPGDSLSPYTIHNVRTGEEYCQVCAYGGKSAKIVAFGKLEDEKFWADLKRLQSLQDKFKALGVFAQITDSSDSSAVKAAAEKYGVHFPVVVPVEKNWNELYKINGESRVIYFAHRNNEIGWTSVGLDDDKSKALAKLVKHDAKS